MWCEAKIFVKNNPSVFVNICGVKNMSQPSSYRPNYHIFPLKIVENEKVEHFDITLFTDGDKSHYIY